MFFIYLVLRREIREIAVKTQQEKLLFLTWPKRRFSSFLNYKFIDR